MKDMQFLIDDSQVIPNIIKVTATYVEPDTDERIGSTIEIIMHLQARESGCDKGEFPQRNCSPHDVNFYKELSVAAHKEAECILRRILELD